MRTKRTNIVPSYFLKGAEQSRNNFIFEFSRRKKKAKKQIITARILRVSVFNNKIEIFLNLFHQLKAPHNHTKLFWDFSRFLGHFNSLQLEFFPKN